MLVFYALMCSRVYQETSYVPVNGLYRSDGQSLHNTDIQLLSVRLEDDCNIIGKRLDRLTDMWITVFFGCKTA